MSVKLTFDEPVLVAMGPSVEEVGWGPYQFPCLSRTDDGDLVATYHVVDDTTEAFGLEQGWAISHDNGKSWEPIPSEDIPAYKALSALRMPSGRRLRTIVPRPVPIDDELRQKLVKKIGFRRFPAIGVEELPEGLVTTTWPFAVSEPGSPEETLFDAALDFPGITTEVNSCAVLRPFAFGRIRVAPNGDLWLPTYASGRNPDNLGYTCYCACYYLQSTDEGRSWKLRSWIQYLPNTEEHPNAFAAEGFCEPDLAWMPDGSMITLLRTHNFTPSYIARSTDGGASWSKPVKFDRCGVLPQLLTMGCGVTLASYGRPGLFVRATDDPSGLRWEDPCELIPYQDPRTGPMASCFYTSLLPMDDRTAMMTYSDFRYEAPDGSKHKAILTRLIHIEKD